MINALCTAVSPYAMPLLEKNLAPDFIVRFGKATRSQENGPFCFEIFDLTVVTNMVEE